MNDIIAEAEDTAGVTYADCLGAAARVWCDEAYSNVEMDSDAAVAIARILYRVANDGEEPPQVLNDLDEETRNSLKGVLI